MPRTTVRAGIGRLDGLNPSNHADDTVEEGRDETDEDHDDDDREDADDEAYQVGHDGDDALKDFGDGRQVNRRKRYTSLIGCSFYLIV